MEDANGIEYRTARDDSDEDADADESPSRSKAGS
jgi:hypothetical protein